MEVCPPPVLHFAGDTYFLSGHSPEQSGLSPIVGNQQQWSGTIPQGVQLPYTQGTSDTPLLDQALNRVFPGGIPTAMEQYLTPTMEPDISSFHRQSGQSPLDSVISLQQLRSDGIARYPGYQVEPSEPAPTKTISLGLANFQQAKPEKEANLPLSPSLEAWLTCQAQTLEGKDRHGRVMKPPFGPKTYPNLPSLKADIYSSPAVHWRNLRYRWRPSSLILNWERRTVISLDLILMCQRQREKTWELAHL